MIATAKILTTPEGLFLVEFTSRRVMVRLDGGSPIPLRTIFADNALSNDEMVDLLEGLLRDGQYIGGGGAAAEFTIELVRCNSCCTVGDIDLVCSCCYLCGCHGCRNCHVSELCVNDT